MRHAASDAFWAEFAAESDHELLVQQLADFVVVSNEGRETTELRPERHTSRRNSSPTPSAKNSTRPHSGHR